MTGAIYVRAVRLLTQARWGLKRSFVRFLCRRTDQILIRVRGEPFRMLAGFPRRAGNDYPTELYANFTCTVYSSVKSGSNSSKKSRRSQRCATTIPTSQSCGGFGTQPYAMSSGVPAPKCMRIDYHRKRTYNLSLLPPSPVDLVHDCSTPRMGVDVLTPCTTQRS